MKNKKFLFQWRQLLPVEIVAGLLILSIVFFVSSNVDINNAEKQLVNTVEYMKEQCDNNQMQELASESKSLLRIAESVKQIGWRLKYEALAQESTSAQNLETLAKESDLSGMFLMDADGNVLESYDATGLTAEAVLSRVDHNELLDVAAAPEKIYTVRLGFADDSYADLAAIGRKDTAGIIVGYYKTSASYTNVFNNSIQLLVSGYMPEHSGIIAVSSGKEIIASNEERLIGTSVDETPILRRIMERGSGKKLIHAKTDGNMFGNDFGLMGKSQSYYIYAFMSERTVFASTPKNLVFALFIYLAVLVVLHMVWWHTKQAYQKRQTDEREKYTNMLEEKNTQLRKVAAQAEKANAAKSNFLSRMSHDIRTPLNGIIGLLRIDEAHFADRELVLENHKKMMAAADHLLSLINDVLEMSKLEDGNVILTHEYIDLSLLTQDIVSIIVDRAIEAGLHWDYEKGKSRIPYPYIYGSPVHLRQIFLNIYGNCIKYNRPGGKITTIVNALEEKDGICTYCWTISDTGIGMSKEFLEHIFEPFTQEESSARSVYQGTGLGMTIVKSLIDQMHGTIEITSEEGVGSTFFITIPFEIAEKQEAPQNTEMEEADLDIHGLHLLLAEDNELNAEIAQMLLLDEGAEVTVVRNGKQAVEQFEQSKPDTFDAILMDIMMPVMDGFAATKEIRSMQRSDTSSIPIIAMTANAFEEDARKCFAAGMNAHLAKPLEVEKLKRTIKEQVSAHKRKTICKSIGALDGTNK